ncbi:MAG: hypothetical protein AAGH49_01190 [Pseudomonadota bacterium]
MADSKDLAPPGPAVEIGGAWSLEASSRQISEQPNAQHASSAAAPL